MSRSPHIQSHTYFETSCSRQLDRIADRMAVGVPHRPGSPKVVVTIPAHNEEETILRCLEGLNRQITVAGRKLDGNNFSIFVLCHNCSDGTYRICSEAKARFTDLDLVIFESDRPEINNVGAVRRILMRMARSRLSASTGYIAMTDADSVAHPRWMANILGYIGSGYGLICGLILLDMDGICGNIKSVLDLKRNYEELRVRLEENFIPVDWDPFPKHSDNSGPNLAVRADVYDKVGGMPPLGFCEDVAFYDAVVQGGYRVRHCPDTMVMTSCRTETRAPWGFGAELSTWAGSCRTVPEVEGLNALLERYAIYRSVLDFYVSRDASVLDSIVERSGIGRKQLQEYFNSAVSGRAMCHKVEKNLDDLDTWRIRYPKKPVDIACSELTAYLGTTEFDFRQTCKR